MQIRGSHVVITGASRGLGAALARVAAQRGARLSLVARDGKRLQAIADELGARAVVSDLSDVDRTRELVPRLEAVAGPIDILVNNAAVSLTGPFIDKPTDQLQKVFLTNLVAPVTLCSQVVPLMLQRGRGAVMTVSSIAGETALKHEAAYCASKSGLTQFIVGLRKELRDTPVSMGIAILGEMQSDMLAEARTDPLIAAVAERFSLLGSLDPDVVAVTIADAIERNRPTVILPRALAPMYYLRQLPDRLIDQLVKNVAVPAYQPADQPTKCEEDLEVSVEQH